MIEKQCFYFVTTLIMINIIIIIIMIIVVIKLFFRLDIIRISAFLFSFLDCSLLLVLVTRAARCLSPCVSPDNSTTAFISSFCSQEVLVMTVLIFVFSPSARLNGHVYNTKVC